ELIGRGHAAGLVAYGRRIAARAGHGGGDEGESAVWDLGDAVQARNLLENARELRQARRQAPGGRRDRGRRVDDEEEVQLATVIAVELPDVDGLGRPAEAAAATAGERQRPRGRQRP